MNQFFQEVVAFFIAHQVTILCSCEVIAWIATVAMGFTRYILKNTPMFIVSTIIAFVAGWVPHLSILIHDTIKNGFHLTLLDYVVITILVLGLTILGKFRKKIDNYFKGLGDRLANKKAYSAPE